ncbi:hypothetical protein HDV00_005422 [Rhizophlyctis rosea]|nr:hypothetical protein HDV00_005422 [Rhizophlyctis rosea]
MMRDAWGLEKRADMPQAINNFSMSPFCTHMQAADSVAGYLESSGLDGPKVGRPDSEAQQDAKCFFIRIWVAPTSHAFLSVSKFVRDIPMNKAIALGTLKPPKNWPVSLIRTLHPVDGVVIGFAILGHNRNWVSIALPTEFKQTTDVVHWRAYQKEQKEQQEEIRQPRHRIGTVEILIGDPSALKYVKWVENTPVDTTEDPRLLVVGETMEMKKVFICTNSAKNAFGYVIEGTQDGFGNFLTVTSPVDGSKASVEIKSKPFTFILAHPIPPPSTPTELPNFVISDLPEPYWKDDEEAPTNPFQDPLEVTPRIGRHFKALQPQKRSTSAPATPRLTAPPSSPTTAATSDPPTLILLKSEIARITQKMQKAEREDDTEWVTEYSSIINDLRRLAEHYEEFDTGVQTEAAKIIRREFSPRTAWKYRNIQDVLAEPSAVPAWPFDSTVAYSPPPLLRLQ